MTEREMLEFAANAAGITIVGENSEGLLADACGCAVYNWRPLTDDGDALRLAVALRTTIEFDGCYVYANDVGLELPDDAGAAAEVVRQAIVMAAAEIGRAMP